MKMRRDNKYGTPINDIGEMARHMVEQGKPINLMILVEESLVNSSKKQELESVLCSYGKILDNKPYSRLMYLNVPNVEQADKIENDFSEGKFEGVVVIEVDAMDVVSHNYK